MVDFSLNIQLHFFVKWSQYYLVLLLVASHSDPILSVPIWFWCPHQELYIPLEPILDAQLLLEHPISITKHQRSSESRGMLYFLSSTPWYQTVAAAAASTPHTDSTNPQSHGQSLPEDMSKLDKLFNGNGWAHVVFYGNIGL
jgi:hypothetical protein